MTPETTTPLTPDLPDLRNAWKARMAQERSFNFHLAELLKIVSPIVAIAGFIFVLRGDVNELKHLAAEHGDQLRSIDARGQRTDIHVQQLAGQVQNTIDLLYEKRYLRTRPVVTAEPEAAQPEADPARKHHRRAAAIARAPVRGIVAAARALGRLAKSPGSAEQ